MTDDSKKNETKPDLEEVMEDDPQSKHGRQGQAEHEHQVAGANSDVAGETVAPQMGKRPNH